MRDLRNARNAEPLEFDELLTDTDGDELDPSDCPECDGTLVPRGMIKPVGERSARLRRDCSRCGTHVEQGWELDRVTIAESDGGSHDARLDSCPTCDGSLTPVGNFFDHHDGSGRQQYACTDCAVDIDEWLTYRGQSPPAEGE